LWCESRQSPPIDSVLAPSSSPPLSAPSLGSLPDAHRGWV